MKRSQTSYEDLIFENRNKSYGAYELRVTYQANLMKSFFIGVGGLTLIAFIIYKISADPDQIKHKLISTLPHDISKTFVIEYENTTVPDPIKKVDKQITRTVSKPVVDPNAFKLVARVVEPLEPAKPDPEPPMPEPISDPIASVGPAIIPADLPSGGIGNRTGLGTTILNSAAVDKLPMFPGGMEGFYDFLSKHMRFPDEARKEGVSGKLFVSFVINKDGNLVEIEFVKKAGYGMEESVMAVLEKSPKWTPGLVGSEQVNTKMVLPVTFNLVQ